MSLTIVRFDSYALPAERLLKEFSKAAELGPLKPPIAEFSAGYPVMDWKGTIIGSLLYGRALASMAPSHYAPIPAADTRRWLDNPLVFGPFAR